MKILRIPYVGFFSPPGTVLNKPALRVKISYKNQETSFDFYSIIDSGADRCVFPAAYGRRIGIDVEKGESVQLLTAVGVGNVYFYSIRVLFKIEKKGYFFDCDAGRT